MISLLSLFGCYESTKKGYFDVLDGESEQEAVQSILSHPELCNAKDEFNWSPLRHAVENCWPQAVKVLCEQGGDPNEMTSGGRLFDRAIGSGSVDILHTLVNFGVDPNWVGPSGEGALAAAVAGGKVPIVAFLLDHGVEPNWGGRNKNLGPVAFVLFTTIATDFGPDLRPLVPKDTRRVEMLQLLHDRGANLGIPYRGQSLLEFAIANQCGEENLNDEINFLQLVLKEQKPPEDNHDGQKTGANDSGGNK